LSLIAPFDPREFLGRFRVILADAPWKYANFTDSAHGAASSAMSTMETWDIAKIPVAGWGHPKGALLASWGTWPKLNHYFPLAHAWGFDPITGYVTGFPWIKVVESKLREGVCEPKIGIGFWGQHVSEYFGLLRSKGFKRRSPKPPPHPLLWVNRDGAEDSEDPLDRVLYRTVSARGLEPGPVLFHPIQRVEEADGKARHSAKPMGIHEWLEQQSDGPYLELFARRPRPGWTTWGYETGFELGPWGVRPRRPAIITAQMAMQEV
jgi:N6-adenosine-specific RNA methylase IME4